MSDRLLSIQAADWYYNDLRQVGLDLTDPAQVTTYDARQRSTDAAAAVFSCEPAALSETVESWLTWMQVERGYSRAENATHVREEHSTFSWVMEGLLERAGFSHWHSEIHTRCVCKLRCAEAVTPNETLYRADSQNHDSRAF